MICFQNLIFGTNIILLMMLDQKKINYNDYSSLSIDVTGNKYRPDVDKVQRLVSKGASIILNDIEKYNTNLLKFR